MHTDLAADFLLELCASFVPSKFVKPLSFQLFCHRKIIIHLSAMTGCWKTQLMDSVGPWNPKLGHLLPNKMTILSLFFLCLFENCTESPLPPWPSYHNQFPQLDPDRNERGKWNIDLFSKGVFISFHVDNAIKTPFSTLNYFTIVQIVERDSKIPGLYLGLRWHWISNLIHESIPSYFHR